MSDTRDRLKSCFRTVFPNLPEASIASASAATVPAWDSLGSITLLQVIEEEFHTAIDLDRLADLDSFESLADYLSIASQNANGSHPMP